MPSVGEPHNICAVGPILPSDAERDVEDSAPFSLDYIGHFVWSTLTISTDPSSPTSSATDRRDARDGGREWHPDREHRLPVINYLVVQWDTEDR